MAGEWITAISTLGGGAVGVAGTLGATWLTQRREERDAARQRRYVIEDAQRQERKEAFLGFLEAVKDLERASMTLAAVVESQRTVHLMRLAEAHHAVTRAGDLVSLVAGEQVIDRVFELVVSAGALLEAAERTPPQLELVDGAAVQRLHEAMREDLRMVPAPRQA